MIRDVHDLDGVDADVQAGARRGIRFQALEDESVEVPGVTVGNGQFIVRLCERTWALPSTR